MVRSVARSSCAGDKKENGTPPYLRRHASMAYTDAIQDKTNVPVMATTATTTKVSSEVRKPGSDAGVPALCDCMYGA